jgi:hypothetical protein
MTGDVQHVSIWVDASDADRNSRRAVLCCLSEDIAGGSSVSALCHQAAILLFDVTDNYHNQQQYRGLNPGPRPCQTGAVPCELCP